MRARLLYRKKWIRGPKKCYFNIPICPVNANPDCGIREFFAYGIWNPKTIVIGSPSSSVQKSGFQ